MLRVIIAILGLPPDEVNTELIVYALELLQAIGPLLPTVKKGKSPYGPVPVLRLEKLVGDSVDRAIIIPALNLLTLLMTTNPAIPPDSPDYYLPPYNPQPNSPPSPTQLCSRRAFLLSRNLGSTVRLLVGIIRYEQAVETRVVPIGPPIKTAAVEDEVPYELTEADLARLAPIPEPERSFEWMRIMFEYSPGSEQTQVTFWNLYKDTFSPYSEYPMLQAADIIRNVTIQFTEANASVVHGANQRFVIQNIKRRPKAAPPHRFKCNWLSATCTSAPLSSSNTLYEHVLSHLEADKDPQKCLWGANTFSHISPKHPIRETPLATTSDHIAFRCRRDIPPRDAAARPPPPPPSTTLTHVTAASGQTTPTSLLGLYSLRLLFWAAFPSTEAAPVPDENRFGFPALPLSQHEQKEERGQSEIREAERRGRQAFRNVRNMLLEVHVPDEGIMGWVAEMVSRTYDDEDEDDEDDGAVESSEDIVKAA
ncbi:hypothetical protein BS47DRAFT_1343897 [Hydnum rufescens UP504]|uniref:RFX-type winged-helix domain-containing protein n=1 Tax=Hydnum rufescens UP504 TaxID=1448309 RepID=A0A9P6AXH0_9AGAM|nr:hypothetical protein BS47DRAFT_1343897 [Hydnum rufescens UP504]